MSLKRNKNSRKKIAKKRVRTNYNKYRDENTVYSFSPKLIKEMEQAAKQ